jgi:hypothetical protein
MFTCIAMTVVAVVAIATSAAAAEPSYPDNFAWAVGWDHHQAGSGFTLELQSPTLYSYSSHGLNHVLSAYLTLSTLTIPNRVTDDDGKFEDQSNSLASLGVHWAVPQFGNLVTTYSQIGAVLLNADSDLAKKSQRYGARIVIGMELPSSITKSESDASKTERLTTFFVQSALIEGLGTADELPAEPDLFNGVSISVGARLHY